MPKASKRPHPSGPKFVMESSSLAESIWRVECNTKSSLRHIPKSYLLRRVTSVSVSESLNNSDARSWNWTRKENKLYINSQLVQYRMEVLAVERLTTSHSANNSDRYTNQSHSWHSYMCFSLNQNKTARHGGTYFSWIVQIWVIHGLSKICLQVSQRINRICRRYFLKSLFPQQVFTFT